MNNVLGHQVDDFIFKMMLVAAAYTASGIIGAVIVVISRS